jgi:hypothetical protein
VRIEFTYSRTSEYFRRLQRPVAIRLVRRILTVALGLAAFGSIAVLVSRGEGVGTVVGFVAVFVALVLPLRARKVFQAVVTVPAAWCAPRTYIVTDEALESSTDLTSARWSWQAVRRVDDRPEADPFWQDSPVMFDLPREPMTADHEAELRAFLNARELLTSKA